MKGRVIRLKMINAPFCPSWHLEHICPAGTRTDMVPASGIKLPFALSPEAAGKGSFPAASTASSSNPPPRVAQSGPTSELSTLSRDDIYDVEMACYLFSVQRDCSSSDSSLSLSHKSVSVQLFSPLHLISFSSALSFSACQDFPYFQIFPVHSVNSLSLFYYWCTGWLAVWELWSVPVREVRVKWK